MLHVGAPKTGSTYLQSVLWRNRMLLRDAGWLYPVERAEEHFSATIDLRGMGWAGRADGPWSGAWGLVAARVASWPGSVILSNELLGGVTAEQAEQVVDALGGAGRDVHVVFTARDLARQLPSDWQEHLKHRHDVTLSRFVGDLVTLGRDAPAPFGELFWGLHDPETVLSTWAELVPAERVHVVTVPQGRTQSAPPPPADQPQSRSGSQQLWQRFAAAAGLQHLDVDLDVEPRNVSLGVVEAELLRRLNTLLRGRLTHEDQYEYLVRRMLSERVLASPQRSVAVSERPTLPPEQQEWALQRSRQMVEHLEQAGYDVVGDLAELIPGTPIEGRQPEGLSSEDLLPAAMDAVVGLLGQLARVSGQGTGGRTPREEIAELRHELERVRAERDYWRDGGLAHRLVRFSDQHPWAMPARQTYTRVRDKVRAARTGP